MRKRVVLIIIITVALSSCGSRKTAIPAMAQAEQAEIIGISQQYEPKQYVRIVAAGDNLIHEPIYLQANQRAKENRLDKGYDFSYCYSEVADIIKTADIAIINQETPLAGGKLPLSTYPMFNSPTELGDQLAETGFDVFSHANNHILDKGTVGISATLDYWDTKPGAAVIGVYRNFDDYNNIRTIIKNGITIAFVGYTEYTNGLKLPDGSEFVIGTLSDIEMMKNQLKKADEIADIVVASVHWGIEDTHTVTNAQRAYAQKLSQWGADIIIGTHPHVLQPIEFIQPEGQQRKTLAAYSLGNFISAQNDAANLIGGILSLEVVKESDNNSVTISNVKLIPTITHYQNHYKQLRVVTFKNYSSELANRHGVNYFDSRFSYEYISSVLSRVIGSEYLAD